MSTTITYKGSTLTTVDNQTRTLKTAGKYMEGDVILTDVTEGGNGGYVWQDENGYVHLDDEGTTPITVESLSITQNGTYTAPTGKAYSPVTVNVSGGGGSPATKKQINFIDYDGTIVESYTKTEWQNVTALPSNPSHTGLTAQGWNWTKAQIDAQLTAMPDGDVWVGQMYITDDGKTRIYIRLEEGRLHPYLGICPNGTVEVDWGDNSATATLIGTSLTSVKYADHEYASGGDYVITLEVTNGTFAFYGTSDTSNILRKDTGTTTGVHTVYTNAVQRIEIGANVSLGNYAFKYCASLTNITIPHGTNATAGYIFQNCYSLTCIVIPDNSNGIGTYAFYSCKALASIAIPSGVHSIGAQAFRDCSALASITIPDDVTSLGTYMFNNCASLASIMIPNSVASLGTYMCNYCYSLARITIPSSVTSIVTSVLNNCYSLVRITIPSSVTSIAAYAFSGCYGMAEYHFLPTTPPTLANTNAFSGIPSDCKIYVPSASLETYKTATNWSTYALYMVGE